MMNGSPVTRPGEVLGAHRLRSEGFRVVFGARASGPGHRGDVHVVPWEARGAGEEGAAWSGSLVWCRGRTRAIPSFHNGICPRGWGGFRGHGVSWGRRLWAHPRPAPRRLSVSITPRLPRSLGARGRKAGRRLLELAKPKTTWQVLRDR